MDEQLSEYLNLIKYTSNQNIIDLLDNPKTGIFSLVDDNCQFKDATDIKLLNAMLKAYPKSDVFEPVKLSKKNEFLIKHSVKPVKYSVEGFIAKNQD